MCQARAGGRLIEKGRQERRIVADRAEFSRTQRFLGPPSATTATDPNEATKTVPRRQRRAQRRRLPKKISVRHRESLSRRVTGDGRQAAARDNPNRRRGRSILVTTSASGLDRISPGRPEFQVSAAQSARRARGENPRARAEPRGPHARYSSASPASTCSRLNLELDPPPPLQITRPIACCVQARCFPACRVRPSHLRTI